MDNPNKNKANSFEKFLNYFKGLFTKEEKHVFEKEIMRDPFEEEAYDGLSILNPEELEKDLYELRNKIEQRTRNKKLIVLPVLRYAAVAVLILALGTTVLLIRKSVEQAPALQDFAQAEDSSLFKTKSLRKAEDTLKKNFAFTDKSAKETEEKSPLQKQKQLAPAKEIEITSLVKDTLSGKKISVTTETEISPSEEPIAMDEVVVIGYGTRKKSKPTGAVSTISTDELSETTQMEALSVEQALQGRVAGVQVEPEGTTDIRIRGTASNKSESPGIELRSMEYNDRTSAGNRMIKGKVVSSTDGEPLPGVNVIVKGTTTGTVSDIDGNFALEVPDEGQTVLAFNFIGFASEEVEIADNNTINLAMSEDLFALEEVVVIGYGTRKKSDLTAAVSSVSTEDIRQPATTTPVIVQPRPVVGLRKYKDYIQENIQYDILPEFEKDRVVKLKFTVTSSGDIRNIRVQKSAGEAFNNEAIRLLTEGPKWIAGTVDGVVAENEVTLKFRFEPRE